MHEPLSRKIMYYRKLQPSEVLREILLRALQNASKQKTVTFPAGKNRPGWSHKLYTIFFDKKRPDGEEDEATDTKHTKMFRRLGHLNTDSAFNTPQTCCVLIFKFSKFKSDSFFSSWTHFFSTSTRSLASRTRSRIHDLRKKISEFRLASKHS